MIFRSKSIFQWSYLWSEVIFFTSLFCSSLSLFPCVLSLCNQTFESKFLPLRALQRSGYLTLQGCKFLGCFSRTQLLSTEKCMWNKDVNLHQIYNFGCLLRKIHHLIYLLMATCWFQRLSASRNCLSSYCHATSFRSHIQVFSFLFCFCQEVILSG